jgi:hypothetical protein
MVPLSMGILFVHTLEGKFTCKEIYFQLGGGMFIEISDSIYGISRKANIIHDT